MNNKVIDILIDIRNKIKRYEESNNIEFISFGIPLEINTEFPITELENNIELNKCNIHGCTYIDVKNWVSIKQGTKIADINNIYIREMMICLKNKTNFLPLEAIIHTFLHELAHTITIPEQILSKNLNKKLKRIQPTVKDKKGNSYIGNHHSDSFIRILLRYYVFVTF